MWRARTSCSACDPISEALANEARLRYLRRVSLRRLFAFLAMVALFAAPFGRTAMAQTMTHHPAMVMAGHCDEMPRPAHGKADKSSIDCMFACATLAPAASVSLEVIAISPLVPQRLPVRSFAGIDLTSDPPPPRIS